MPERRKPINVRRGLELVGPLWTCNVIILSWLPSLPPELVLPTDYPIPINSAATIYHCPRKSHSLGPIPPLPPIKLQFTPSRI